MIRLSNTNLNQSFNLITPNHHNSNAADHTLLTFKRQSFKLSKQFNNHLQHRTTDHDTDQDLDNNNNNNIANNNNNNNNNNDDFEKAFNDFYINNKIEKPNNIHNEEEEDIKIRSKAKPRRSLFKMLFQSKSDETSHRFRLFKNRSKLIIHNNNNNKNNYDDYFDYGSNLKNINLDLVENEFKKHSVKDIIYLKLNKSLFNLNQNNYKLSNTTAFIDVTIERLQQTNKNMHLLTLNLKNLKVEPLFEINHVKSKLSYFKINLCDSDEISNECINDRKTQYHLNNTNNSAYYNYDSNRKNFLRIHRIKRCKLKFNANNKSLQKPIDFELDDEHFMQVNSEATFLITKQQPNINNNNNNNNSSNDPIYLFLLSIELHSYLPVSRLKLSSTFSKKKKMFQGVCRINENFILNTQFNKKIDLHEI